MEIRYGRYWNRSLNKCAFPRWWRGEDEQQAGVLLCHGWIYKAGMQGKLRVESGSQDPTIKRGPSLLSNYLILIFLAFLVFPSPSPPSSLPDVASFLFRFFETRDFLIPKKKGKVDDLEYPLNRFFFSLSIGFLLARRKFLISCDRMDIFSFIRTMCFCTRGIL